MERTRILVLCGANSCRSQMTQGYLEHFAGATTEVFSAGLTASVVNPHAVVAMREDGIDISHHTSNHMDEYRHLEFDHVITVCDNTREVCPWFPANAVHHHHAFTDPTLVTGSEEAIAAAFRSTREEVKQYCRAFANTYLQSER
jgi:arsenate reductase (thioredoxin)